MAEWRQKGIAKRSTLLKAIRHDRPHPEGDTVYKAQIIYSFLQNKEIKQVIVVTIVEKMANTLHISNGNNI